MPVSDMTGQKGNMAKRGHMYETSFTPNNDGFNDEFPSEDPNREPYMDIDTPSDEFYTINTNRSIATMSARHKLQPRLLRPIQIQIHFIRNKPNRNGLVLSTCQDIFMNFGPRD